MAKAPRAYSPKAFIAFAKQRLADRTEQWQIFKVEGPGNEYPVDIEDLAHPGIFDLRKLEDEEFVSYASVRINENGTVSSPSDPNVILARTLETKSASVLDAMLMDIAGLRSQLETERARNDKLVEDNERYREAFHEQKDKLRDVTLEKAGETREQHLLEIGLQAFSVWMNADFRSQFKERLARVYKKLPDDKKQAVIDLFNSDEFRIPPEMLEQETEVVS